MRHYIGEFYEISGNYVRNWSIHQTFFYAPRHTFDCTYSTRTILTS